MKPPFRPNIGATGQLVRGALALLLFAGAAFLYGRLPFFLTLMLAISGAFVMFEALRGWCALRACGIKTRL